MLYQTNSLGSSHTHAHTHVYYVASQTKLFLNTHEELLVVGENSRIQEQLKKFCTPHVIRSTMVLSFTKMNLVSPRYSLC